MTMQEIEAWAVVNSDGEYEVATDEAVAMERFEENCSTDGGRRLVKITLKVPLPETIEVSGSVTVEETVGELKAV